MKVTIWTFIIGLVLFAFANWALADSETLHPTGSLDAAAKWANDANAYDDSLTTYTSMTASADASLYVGAVTAVGTDAWDAPSDAYTAGTFYCTHMSTGFTDNDKAGVFIVNGSDAVVYTCQAMQIAAWSKTTCAFALAGGYLADPTDLRCKATVDQVKGPDQGNFRIYEVWINGNWEGGVPPSRRRTISQ